MSVPNPKEYYEDGLRDGALNERERIIKLLEDPYSMLGSNIANWQFGCDNEAKLQAFEIIRGENK